MTLKLELYHHVPSRLFVKSVRGKRCASDRMRIDWKSMMHLNLCDEKHWTLSHVLTSFRKCKKKVYVMISVRPTSHLIVSVFSHRYFIKIFQASWLNVMSCTCSCLVAVTYDLISKSQWCLLCKMGNTVFSFPLPVFPVSHSFCLRYCGWLGIEDQICLFVCLFI